MNGAGKTSLFKMLTGDVSITAGNAFVLRCRFVDHFSTIFPWLSYVCIVTDYSVRRDIHSVLKNIGYCPQFDAINGLLTGCEHLTLYAQLKGIAEEEVSGVRLKANTVYFSYLVA